MAGENGGELREGEKRQRSKHSRYILIIVLRSRNFVFRRSIF